MSTNLRPCDYCGTPTAGEVEHSIPRARGGTNHAANLAHACTRCNAEKSDRTVEEWAADRVRVGLSWPPAGRRQFVTNLEALMSDEECRLIDVAIERDRVGMQAVVLDLYDAARNVPTFTYAKAAADLIAVA